MNRFRVIILAAVMALTVNAAFAQNNNAINKQAFNNFELTDFDAETQFIVPEQAFSQTVNRAKAAGDWWEPDTIYRFYLNYELIGRYTFIYNQQGYTLTRLYEFLQNDNWGNVDKYTYTYDENNNMLMQLQEKYSNDNWVNSDKRTYTYDLNNNLLTSLRESYNNENWVNVQKNIYTYDSNNLLICLNQIWQNDNWIDFGKYTYTYDANNNMLMQLYEMWSNDNWVNREKYTYTYDDRNNKITHLIENWQNNDYVNYWKYTYSYDVNNNEQTQLLQIWQNDNWVNNFTETNTYDSKNKILTRLVEFFEEKFKNQKRQWTYDENNNAKLVEYFELIDQIWQTNNGSLALYYNNMQSFYNIGGSYLSYKVTASYKKFSRPIASIDNYQFTNSGISIFPNPSNGIITVKTLHATSPQNDATIQIYDISGRVVQTQFIASQRNANENEITIDISHLQQGMYYLRIGNETVKIIKN